MWPYILIVGTGIALAIIYIRLYMDNKLLDTVVNLQLQVLDQMEQDMIEQQEKIKKLEEKIYE